jgi:NADH:ubiquinone oxidoreductase subunit 4 (subunit M)
MVLSAIYSIWLYNRLIFGEIKNVNISIRFYDSFIFKKWFKKFSDINKRELYIFIPLIILNFILGIYPSLVLNVTYISIINILI